MARITVGVKPAAPKSTAMSIDFRGECVAVHLEARGHPHDRHVMMTLHDDCGKELGPLSSYWIEDLYCTMAAAEAWMDDNCDLDKDVDGVVWGWKFRRGAPKNWTYKVVGRGKYVSETVQAPA
jgi:hypothetical protein